MAITNSWQLVATLNFSKPTLQALPVAVSQPFSSKLIKVESKLANVPVRWRRAGYLQQVSDLSSNGIEFESVVVPLNVTKLFSFPLFSVRYQLIFLPVRWLPQGLRVRFFQYTGPLDEGLDGSGVVDAGNF